MRTTGNTIFLPGATSGIGLGLALRFAEAGNHVIIGGRRKELLDQISGDNDNIDAVVIDTSDPESIRSVAADVQARFPETNVLIPMAGIMRPEDLTAEGFLETAEATIATNLLGPIRLYAAFAEFLAAKESAAVLTVSSGLAFTPLPLTATYNATKAAIHSWTESLRVQLAGTGVQVIELVPPAVQTDLMPGPNTARAMPLEDFLTETMQLLESQPDAKEILVESVKPLRFSAVDGHYDELLAMLSGNH
jgi:uncharacterized oxidoreductase